MANVTWTKTTSGTVQDTQGNNVGTADGAGTITINVNTDVEVGSANDTLTITEGVTVKFPISATRRGFDVNASGSTYGRLVITGTSSEPVTITSAEVSPAPGDWRGIRFTGGTTTNGGRVTLTRARLLYGTTLVESQSGAGFVLNSVVASFCTFGQPTTAALSHQAGQGGSFPWDISYCVFYGCTSLTGTQPLVLCNSGGLPSGSDRAKMTLDHCSFLLSANDVGIHPVVNFGARTDGEVTNCVLYGANAGSGTCTVAVVTGTGVAVTNNNNFYFTDGGVGTYAPDATDQNVDPSFTALCPTPNLSPDAQVGSPDLYIADSGGSYVGAVEPYNYPSGSEPDPVGTTGVWAGRKQRVYECTFGLDSNKTLGRAIRIGLSSSDLQGQKLLGGLFLRANPERLK